jgi:hypothetical protein
MCFGFVQRACAGPVNLGVGPPPRRQSLRAGRPASRRPIPASSLLALQMGDCAKIVAGRCLSGTKPTNRDAGQGSSHPGGNGAGASRQAAAGWEFGEPAALTLTIGSTGTAHVAHRSRRGGCRTASCRLVKGGPAAKALATARALAASCRVRAVDWQAYGSSDKVVVLAWRAGRVGREHSGFGRTMAAQLAVAPEPAQPVFHPLSSALAPAR